MLIVLVLQSKGIEKECVVALHLRRGFQVIDWILATLKAGGAFVYIDPSLNDSRKQAILAISDPVLIITEDELVDNRQWAYGYEHSLLSHMSIEDVASVVEPGPSRNPKPQDLAYIICTSGSTGIFLNQLRTWIWLLLISPRSTQRGDDRTSSSR